MMDGFLTELFALWFDTKDSIALFAVGGYGRGELHPRSDVDLLILVSKRDKLRPKIESFVRFLWDLNLDIGHSVRDLADCKRAAMDDLSVMTALLERRLLAGSNDLAQKLDRTLSTRNVWPSKRFFAAKQLEQYNRHEQFGDVEYGLEPDVKSTPGGLRDLQTIGWITRKHFGTDATEELDKMGVLTEQEQSVYLGGRSFLWRVRFALHLIAGRKTDQLRFEHQREIASRFGYVNRDDMLAVEQFMHKYYRYLLELREVNDILLQHFNEVILPTRRRDRIKSINDRFQIRNKYIEVVADEVFRRQPSALMEMFVIMSNREDIQGVRASTIRLIRDSLDLIDDRFRADSEVSRLFLELLRAPIKVVSQLTRMRRYGILARYIPQFGDVIGQMQHDLFHIYTVDAHTMMVIRQMRRLYLPEYRDTFPLASRAAQHIPKVELLFLAGLFHDIGKGRGGDHSTLGASDAYKFCRQLGLEDADCELVEWLVQHHLVMSTTSQKENIYDPVVVDRFTQLVESQDRLNYLYALTVTDINATNPNLWNDYRSALLNYLYHATQSLLKEDPSYQAGRSELIAVRRRETLETLARDGVSEDRAGEIWDDAGDDLLVNHESAQLADLTLALASHDFDSGPLVVAVDAMDARDEEEGATELFICSENRVNLFADCVAALDQLRLQVLNAKIETGHSQRCYDSFFVLDQAGRKAEDERIERATNYLREVIVGNRKPRRRQERRISRQLRQFVLPASVTLTEASSSGLSRLEITTSDRPGLLALIGEGFAELDVELHEARIQTLGERVEDVFVISLQGARPISSREKMQTIIDTLTDRIDKELERAA